MLTALKISSQKPLKNKKPLGRGRELTEGAIGPPCFEQNMVLVELISVFALQRESAEGNLETLIILLPLELKNLIGHCHRKEPLAALRGDLSSEIISSINFQTFTERKPPDLAHITASGAECLPSLISASLPLKVG